eukprot:5161749-Amphidinium_carterae.1
MQTHNAAENAHKSKQCSQQKRQLTRDPVGMEFGHPSTVLNSLPVCGSPGKLQSAKIQAGRPESAGLKSP